MQVLHDNRRISNKRPLLPPAILIEEIPITETATSVVDRGREACEAILENKDDRLIVIAGPCSIHDTRPALEYAEQLLPLAQKHAKELVIIMRV